MSGRGAIIMAECPKSKNVVLLISGNSSLNGKAATEEFPEHLDLVFLDFHCFPFTTVVAVQSRFSREVRVFFVEKRVHSFQESWKSIPEH